MRVASVRVRSVVALPIFGLAASGFSSQVLAQAMENHDIISVRDRARPDFDPKPLHVGAFDIGASGDIKLRYDDNIYAVRTDKVDDASTTLGGTVSARTRWSRNEIAANGNVSLSRGLSQRNEDTNTYNGGLRTRLDLGGGIIATAKTSYGKAYEPRGSIGDTTLRGRRLGYDQFSLGGDLTRSVGRLVLAVDASLSRYTYGNYNDGGVTIASASRDYRRWNGGGRVGYALGPGVSTFIEADYNEATYPKENALLDRSSQGYSVRGGVEFGVTRLIRGRAAAGYRNQTFEASLFPSIKGLDYSVSLEWSPTQLFTASAFGARTIQRSPIVNVAGILQSNYGVRLDYELRRNVVLSANGGYNQSKYVGLDRQQKDRSASLEAVWYLNRHLRAAGQFGLERTRSNAVFGREFDRKYASVSLRYAL